MYFAAGLIRTKAHGYLYDSSSLPHRKGKLAKISCRIQIMNVLSPKPREATEAGCGGHAPFMTPYTWMQGFHFLISYINFGIDRRRSNTVVYMC